jgi:cytochrome c
MNVLVKLGVVAVLTLALAGCGGSSSPAPAASSAAASPGTAAPAPAASATLAAADAAPVEFGQCKACHAVEAGKNGVGPSLAGVFGRKAGSAPGYTYSDAFKKLDVSWDEGNLDKWLENPMKMAPGTRMTFSGLADKAKRQAITDYLKTLK